ncbi:hypothetical protein GCM10010340_36210 [Streptomyces griseoloalbus]|nr:hypothetical protein GCM10010340_36210 [Streptomyces albaduncus]
MENINARVRLRRIRLSGTVSVGSHPRAGCAQNPDGSGGGQPDHPEVQAGRRPSQAPLPDTSADGCRTA